MNATTMVTTAAQRAVNKAFRRGMVATSTRVGRSSPSCVVPTATIRSFHSSSPCPAADEEKKDWKDPASRQYKYWNREKNASEKGQYSYLIEISPESVAKEAKILSLSEADDHANQALHDGSGLPLGSSLLGIGTELSHFDSFRQDNNSASNPNVLFVSPSCPRAASTVPLVLAAFPSIEWVHVRSAGIDFVESESFATITNAKNIMVTNAKGQFSSSLAEYALLACSYFAKDVPRLMQQKKDKNWNEFHIQELRGKTLGIVGYGDM